MWGRPGLASTKFGGRVMGRMSSNMEKPGKTNLGNVGGIINNPMGEVKQHNVPNALRIRAGKPPLKGH